jgi:cytochrome P450
MVRRATIVATPDFFEVPAPAPTIEGTQDYRTQVSQLVSRMLADAALAGKDRYAVAAEMSRLTGQDISKAMLDGYAAEARDTFNIPLSKALVLEVACQSHALTNWMVAKRGGKLLLGAEAINAEIGRLQRIADDAARRARELKTQARYAA